MHTTKIERWAQSVTKNFWSFTFHVFHDFHDSSLWVWKLCPNFSKYIPTEKRYNIFFHNSARLFNWFILFGPFFVLFLPVIVWEMSSLVFQLLFIIFFLPAILLVLSNVTVTWKGLGNNLVMDCYTRMKPHFFLLRTPWESFATAFFSPRRLYKVVLVAIHSARMRGQSDSRQFPWVEPWFPENIPSAQHFLEQLGLLPNARPEVPILQ